MQISILDWVVVAAYFLLNIAIGFYYKKRAGTSVDEFFLSGRDVPWWLAGTSMVATTFAADTPLAVTGMVARNGIAGNWLWWNFVAGGMLVVFFYARLWRRSGVMTDIDFSEIRYSGKPAAFLRGFRALYFGIPIALHLKGPLMNTDERRFFDGLTAQVPVSSAVHPNICVDLCLSAAIDH